MIFESDLSNLAPGPHANVTPHFYDGGGTNSATTSIYYYTADGIGTQSFNSA